MRMLAVLLLCAGLLASPAQAAVLERDPCFNGFLLTLDGRVERFDERGAAHVTMPRLPMSVNALAYLPGEDLFYAVAGDRVVTLDRQGRLTDRAPVPPGMRGAWSGTELDGKWIVHSGREILTVSTPDLVVTHRVRLGEGGRVGDWDAYAGSLYGILDGTPPKLVAVDPGTGAVTAKAVLRDLPGNSAYGSVVVDRFGVLHALHNGTGRLYHVPLADPPRYRHTDLGFTTVSSDAAPCPVVWDYGDAPESFGASQHTPTSVGSLGIGVSLVEDGLPGPVRVDAESSAVRLTVAVRNTTAAPGLLAGWIDLDLDGGFQPDELARVEVPPRATSAILQWPSTGLGANGNHSWLRLRLYPGAPSSVEPFGTAAGGEVEDHEVVIVRRPPPIVPDPPPVSPDPPPAVPNVPAPPPAVPNVPAPPPAKASPSPTPSPFIVPAPRPANPPSPSGRLPLTLSVFAGLLVPAITVAARAVARKGT